MGNNDDRGNHMAKVIKKKKKKSYLSLLGRPTDQTPSTSNSTNDVIQHFWVEEDGSGWD